MNFRRHHHNVLFAFIAFILLWSCTDLELKDENNQNLDNLTLNSRTSLSKKILDSTKYAEALVTTTVDNSKPIAAQPFALAPPVTVNYSLSATVTAESTFPGYDVSRIKDGSRITTVGPAYSWANNHPSGGKLPESVFLKLIGTKTINRVDIYSSTGYVLKNYTIQYKTASGAWLTVLSITGNTAAYRSHIFSPVITIEVRIICELGPDNQSVYGRLNEVEIYGTPPTLPSISVENGMLSFSTFNNVNQTVDYLEYKYEEYDDAFLVAHPGLTDDEIGILEESLGYNDQQPYINFETQYGISSKRAQINAAEDNWLATTPADYPNQFENPDYLFVQDDQVRTIINVNGEVRVAATYYHFNDDGTYYEVGLQYYNELVALRSLKSGQPLPEHVRKVTFGEATITSLPPPCKAGKTHRDSKANFGWKYDYVTGLWNFPWEHRIIARTKSYQLKNGKWKKKRAQIGAQIWGTVYDKDCASPQYLESNLREGRKKTIHAKRGTGAKIKTYPGEVASYHYNVNVGSINYVLTW